MNRINDLKLELKSISHFLDNFHTEYARINALRFLIEEKRKRLIDDIDLLERVEKFNGLSDAPCVSKNALGIEDVPNENFIHLTDFFFQYRLSQSTIGNLLKTDENFFRWCGQKKEGLKGKYYIQPVKALRYLSVYGGSKIRYRAKNILKEMEERCLQNQ